MEHAQSRSLTIQTVALTTHPAGGSLPSIARQEQRQGDTQGGHPAWPGSRSILTARSGASTVASSAASSSISAAASTAASSTRARRSPTSTASAPTCSTRSDRSRCRCCAGRAATSSAATTGSTASGRRDERPRKSELAWLAEESNRFGTDEFIEYCRVLDTEPYICINMGTGTIDEAQAWVEYCNGTGNTHWANLRRKHGHEEPYNVRYWGLGNELYGGWQLGASTADDYVKKAREFAKVMKLTDPSIELISCGQNGWSDWDRVVIDGLAAIRRLPQHPHLHRQRGLLPQRLLAAPGRARHPDLRRLHRAGALHPADQPPDRHRLRRVERLVPHAQPRRAQGRHRGAVRPLRRAGHRDLPEHLHPRVQARPDRQPGPDGQRHRADLHQPGRPVPPDDLPPAAPVRRARPGDRARPDRHLRRPYALESDDEAGQRGHRIADLGPFKLLDVSATRNEAGRPSRSGSSTATRTDADHHDRRARRRRAIASAAVYEVNGDDPHVLNSFERPDAVTVQERQATPAGASLELTLPAHSATVVRLTL